MVDRECRDLGGLERIRLCALPTPLMEARRLTESLGGPRVFIKRDDLTGLAMGGNKARALEFVMAEAGAAGHDLVIAVGPQHSNQLCCIAAAARRCGMDVVLLLLAGDNRPQGNLLLFRLLGAEVRFTGVDLADIDEAHAQMEDLAERLRQEGRRPLELRYGPLPLVGAAGYVLLLREILDQLEDASSGETHIFAGSGSGLTQAGLILGGRLMGSRCRVQGVMLDRRFSQQEHEQNVSTRAEAAAGLFAAGVRIDPGDVVCIDGYSHDDPTIKRKTAEARRLMAETEGIFLDPIYTDRVMAAMIDQIRAGRIDAGDSVVFYHSGGIPAVFGHTEVQSLWRPGVPEPATP